jgi:hypothetical protein
VAEKVKEDALDNSTNISLTTGRVDLDESGVFLTEESLDPIRHSSVKEDWEKREILAVNSPQKGPVTGPKFFEP